MPSHLEFVFKNLKLKRAILVINIYAAQCKMDEE